jgi:N-methylhydantoinase A
MEPGVLLFGIDTGGTFTDVACRHRGGVLIVKVPSTRDDPARAIVEGVRRALEQLAAAGAAPRLRIVHGSTVATNAILERKGARTAFITSAGFRDLIEIGRQSRPRLYDLRVRRPEPLAPRRLRLEAEERIDDQGAVLEELDLRALEGRLRERGGEAESFAIGFLFSARNPVHERAAARCVRRLFPGRPVTLSSKVSPELREYERFSTAILNAYVAPRMQRYLASLRRRLPAAEIEIMASGGGTAPIGRAREEPILTVLSGPAAGVLGARELASRAGFERAITIDMGGTSTDVSLIDRSIGYRSESSIGGLPFRIPTLDVHTVGAGGGSIARIDSGGSLRVGPESAGADPGPAVYGKGDRLTVTDAHVYLGHLGRGSFLGGAMAIQPERAAPLVESMARRLGLSPAALARGVLRVVETEMERAIRVVSEERGHDPRRFVLVAFGGASGLHAAALAEGLLIPAVIVPPHPGALCALGMLDAERVRWRSRAVQEPAARCSARRLERIALALARDARRDFPSAAAAALRHRLELDLRFEGQAHAVTLSWSGAGPAVRIDDDYEAVFRARYVEHYGIAEPRWIVEVVAARLRLSHGSPPRRGGERGRRSGPRRRRPRPTGLAQVLGNGKPGAAGVPIFERQRLEPGDGIRGPAIVAEYSGTTLVPAGWRLKVDGGRNLVLTR